MKEGSESPAPLKSSPQKILPTKQNEEVTGRRKKEPVMPVKCRSERRAAQIASTKIAESVKILASSKIIATGRSPGASGKDPTYHVRSPRGRGRGGASGRGRGASSAPVLLPKMPVLVFNPSTGLTSPMQSFIPATSISGFGTPAAAPRPKPVVLSTGKSSASVVISTPTTKRKSTGNSSNAKHSTGLIMECEDDALTPIQWSTYKKAENDYLEVLRKLSKWKSRADVEIVRVGADDPIPPVPEFLSVSEAAKLPLPNVTATYESVKPSQTAAKPTNAPVQLQKGTVISAGQAHLIIRPISQPSTAASSSGPQESVGSTASPLESSKLPGDSSFSYKLKSVFIRYPELSIRLTPQKLLPLSVLSAKKEELDAIFKTLSSSGRLAMEKWMLEKGLFGATRYCLFHSNVQMKLMYMSCLNDKLRKSGYKWWCPHCAVMVPVTQGSFFSKWKNTHHEILRLIYHWACNTEMQTVISEYILNGELVSSVYTALRSICNAQSLQWRLGGVGGATHSVEVAWLQIGNCQDFEDISIFCAYDRVTRLVILGASATCAVKTKLSVLLRTLVAKESIVVGDRQLLQYLPPHFRSSFVCSPSMGPCAHQNASSYLRDQVACWLKGQIVRLKLQSIQALLDELSWREKFGQNPHEAFTNIILHIKQAYVCSVVTTKSVNSLPITMATGVVSGVKVVDEIGVPGKIVPKTDAAIAAINAMSEGNNLDVPFPSEKWPPSCISIKEVPESNVTSAPVIDINEDSCSMFPSADVLIEEFPPMEMDTTADKMQVTVTLDSDAEEDKYGYALKTSEHSGKTAVVIIKGADGNVTITQEVSQEKEDPGMQRKIPLDTYYYARMDGNSALNECQTKAKYRFKCPACKKVIEDNVKMMKHMYGHIDDLKQLKLDLSDLTQCKFCFREFASPYAMQSHIEEVHVPEPLTPVCRICDKEFNKKTRLLRHMQMLHTPAEMPYKCFICKYRTSFYREIIDHFQQVHDHTDKLLCRYCLKVFTIRFSNIGMQEGVAYSFYRHLYKHQTKSTSRRCQFCCLTFLTVTELQQHRVTDHTSFKNNKGVKPIEVSNKANVTWINPAALTKIISGKNISTVEVEKPKKPAAVAISSESKSMELKCIECKMALHKTNHFMQVLRCSMCTYITMCARAFTDHAIHYHSVPPRAVSKPYSRHLGSWVYCLCGYQTYLGDKMARHLLKCSRTWCYFENDNEYGYSSDSGGVDIEFKKPFSSYSQPEITMVDLDAEEPMEVCQPSDMTSSSSDNDDKHNMLNLLGLMRVPSLKRNTHSKKSTNLTKSSNSKDSDEASVPQESTSWQFKILNTQ